jgi:hypothetical protein
VPVAPVGLVQEGALLPVGLRAGLAIILLESSYSALLLEKINSLCEDTAMRTEGNVQWIRMQSLDMSSRMNG